MIENGAVGVKEEELQGEFSMEKNIFYTCWVCSYESNLSSLLRPKLLVSARVSAKVELIPPSELCSYRVRSCLLDQSKVDPVKAGCSTVEFRLIIWIIESREWSVGVINRGIASWLQLHCVQFAALTDDQDLVQCLKYVVVAAERAIVCDVSRWQQQNSLRRRRKND